MASPTDGSSKSFSHVRLMSLFAATVSTALALLGLGLVLIWNGSHVSAIARSLPRSQRLAWLTIGISTLWTLYHITKLGESDFGNFKMPLGIGFVALAGLSLRFVPDFLAVRGACALTLLVASVLLSAAFTHWDESGRLFLVSLAYVGIGLALYLAVSPFRARDFFQWLFARPQRPRMFGMLCSAYALVLLGAAFTYA